LSLSTPIHSHSLTPPPILSTDKKQGPGKKWEHYPLNKNGNVERIKIHVQLGDLVKVIAGSDSGRVGRITKVNLKTGQVIVEGVNIKTKHVKPTAQGEAGQIIKKEYPVHHSNVQLYSEKEGVTSRVAMKEVNGKKVRVLIKTGEEVQKQAPAAVAEPVAA